jgi:hypothetical protein
MQEKRQLHKVIQNKSGFLSKGKFSAEINGYLWTVSSSLQAYEETIAYLG